MRGPGGAGSPRLRRLSRQRAEAGGDAEPAAKPKTSRGKAATGTGRGRKKKAGGDADAAAEGTEPKPVVAEQKEVIRTGSADRHLASDEPIAPQPVTQPRTFRDLDEIPDDFD